MEDLTMEYGNVLKELSECESIEEAGKIIMKYRIKWINTYVKSITDFDGANVKMVEEFMGVNHVTLPKFCAIHLASCKK